MSRNKADKILENKAWSKAFSRDENLITECFSALALVMNTKLDLDYVYNCTFIYCNFYGSIHKHSL